MRQLSDYVAAAVGRNGLRGAKHLSLVLGLNHTAVTQYLMGRAWPSEAVMVKLAELAAIDPDVALLELAAWRAKDQAVRRRFERLAAAIAGAAAVLLLALPAVPSLIPLAPPVSRTAPERASAEPAGVYIMRLWRRLAPRQWRPA